jgi:hypothetical protein
MSKPRGVCRSRQANQYRELKYPWELSEGAELLLSLIKRYQYAHNVTNTQYAHLMKIERRNLVSYMNELEYKDRIITVDKHKKMGRGKPNKRIVVENFDPKKWCEKNGISYESYF